MVVLFSDNTKFSAIKRDQLPAAHLTEELRKRDMLLLWCERKCECEYLFLLLYVVVVSVKSCFCEQMVLLLLEVVVCRFGDAWLWCNKPNESNLIFATCFRRRRTSITYIIL